MEHIPLEGFPGYSITREGEVWTWWKKCGSRPAVLTDAPVAKMKLRKLGLGRYKTVGIYFEGKQYGYPVHLLARIAFVGLDTSTGSHAHLSEYPGYSVTDTGEVWLWRNRVPYNRLLSKNQTGYPRVAIVNKQGRRVNRFVHHLVLESFVGPRPEGMEARHLNGDQTNSCVSNLAWGTRQENADDRKRHGTVAKGARIGTSKLTDNDVLEIRRRRANGEALTALGREFGVSYCNCWDITTGRSWKHLPL